MDWDIALLLYYNIATLLLMNTYIGTQILTMASLANLVVVILWYIHIYNSYFTLDVEEFLDIYRSKINIKQNG